MTIHPAQERTVEAVRVIAVRIDDADAASVDDVLSDTVFEELGLAGSGCADDLHMFKPGGKREDERITAFMPAGHNCCSIRRQRRKWPAGEGGILGA